jgi:hypothetical protein
VSPCISPIELRSVLTLFIWALLAGKRPAAEPVFPAPVFIAEIPPPVSAPRTPAAAATTTNPTSVAALAPAAPTSTSTSVAASAASNNASNVNRTTSWPSIADKLKEDLAKQEREQPPNGINYTNINGSDAYSYDEGGSADKDGGDNASESTQNNSNSAIAAANGASSSSPAPGAGATGAAGAAGTGPASVVLSTRNAKVAARKQQQLEREQAKAQRELLREQQQKEREAKREAREKEQAQHHDTSERVNGVGATSAASVDEEDGDQPKSLASDVGNLGDASAMQRAAAGMNTSMNANTSTPMRATGSVSPLTVSSMSTGSPRTGSGTSNLIGQLQLPAAATSATSSLLFNGQSALPPLALPANANASASGKLTSLQALLSTPPLVPTLLGPYRHSVFPLLTSSLNTPTGVWTHILAKSNAHSDLSVNPYGALFLCAASCSAQGSVAFSDLFDAVLPPVDGMCLLGAAEASNNPTYVQTLLGWPRPESFYKRLARPTNGYGPAHNGMHGMHGVNGVGMTSADSVPASSSLLQSIQQSLVASGGMDSSSMPGTPATNGSSIGMGSDALAAANGIANGNGSIANGKAGAIPVPVAGSTNAMAALQQMFPGVKMSFGAPKQQLA